MSLKASITMMRGFMPTGLVNKSVMTDEVGAYLNTFLSQTHSNRRGGGGRFDGYRKTGRRNFQPA